MHVKTKHCVFCLLEIKGRDYTVHNQCGFYCHTACFSSIKSNPLNCKGCFSTSEIRKNCFSLDSSTKLRLSEHSAAIRSLEAKFASRERKDGLKAQPIVNLIVAGNNNNGNNYQRFPTALARQHRSGNARATSSQASTSSSQIGTRSTSQMGTGSTSQMSTRLTSQIGTRSTSQMSTRSTALEQYYTLSPTRGLKNFKKKDRR